jgi:uncharacterized SAM-binding protein YcdF (DUF218 family)
MNGLKNTIIILITITILYIVTVTFLILSFDSNISSDEIANADYILILGSHIDGLEPGERMQERLDYSLPILQQTDVPIIVSGGQGPNEETYEAYVMRDYLVDHGIDETRIIVENQATSTYENLVYSFELMTIENPNILVISSDYHMFRVNMLCNRLDYYCSEGGSETSSEANPLRREVVAVGKSFLIDR